MKRCPNCRTQLPDEARFCLECGTPQVLAPKPGPSLKINWDRDLAPQITALFFAALRERVREEHQSDQYALFSERLYESGFRDTLQRRVDQLAERLQTQLATAAISNGQAASRIELFFDELLDFFIIRYARDLVEVPLPEAILKYHGLSWEQIDIFQMVLDYLDFAEETETVYTDFLVMPMDKLKNAGRSFLFPEKSEKILLICDQSILGSCKEGFALTEAGVYWKAHLQKSRQVMFRNLQDIAREKDWITINGHFFNVNPSLNIKMLKLLKKIKRLQTRD